MTFIFFCTLKDISLHMFFNIDFLSDVLPHFFLCLFPSSDLTALMEWSWCGSHYFHPLSSWFFGATTFPLLLHHPDSITLLFPPPPFLKSHFPPATLLFGQWAPFVIICDLSATSSSAAFNKTQLSHHLFSLLSLPHLICFQAHCHRHNRIPIQSFSLSVFLRIYPPIYAAALVLRVPASLATVTATHARVPVQRPPGSNVTYHTLTSPAHIWSPHMGVIYKRWVAWRSLSRNKTSSQKAGSLLEGCRMGGDISASICFTGKKRRRQWIMAYLLQNVAQNLNSNPELQIKSMGSKVNFVQETWDHLQVYQDP